MTTSPQVTYELAQKVAQDFLTQVNNSVARLRHLIDQANNTFIDVSGPTNDAKAAAVRAEAAALSASESLGSINDAAVSVTSQLNAHKANFNNPHQVTAAQIGVYSKSEIDEIVRELAAGEIQVPGGGGSTPDSIGIDFFIF